MASEYDIYRAYAGMNTPQSKFDYFLDGVQRLQKVANENRRLDLQEKRLEKEDDRAQDRLDLQVSQEDRMQQQFDYNKNKDIEDRKYNKQMQAWNSITDFAKSLPEGVRYNFMEKQANSVMDADFMDSQNLWDNMKAFKEAEEDGIVQGDMYYNLKNEDSADKIEQALKIGVIKDNTKKQHLQNRINNIRKAEKKWKPFDLDLLSFKDKSTYEAIKADYDDKLEMLMSEKTSGLPPTDPDLGNKVATLETQLKGYQKRASTAPLPEFTASTESLQMITDDDDLMTAFFADQSNNLDDFIKGRSGSPEPAEVKPDSVTTTPPDTIKVDDDSSGIQGSIWKPAQKEVQIQSAGGVSTRTVGDFEISDNAPEFLKDPIRRKNLENKLSSDIVDHRKQIDSIDNQLKQMDGVMKTLSGTQLEKVRARYDKQNLKKQGLENKLQEYESSLKNIKKPNVNTLASVE